MTCPFTRVQVSSDPSSPRSPGEDRAVFHATAHPLMKVVAVKQTAVATLQAPKKLPPALPQLPSTPDGLHIPRSPTRQPCFLLHKEKNYQWLPGMVLGLEAPLGLECASREGGPWECPSGSILTGKH